MEETIFAAIINGFFKILTSKKPTLQPDIETIEIPRPFPCASCAYELIDGSVSPLDNNSYSLNFNLSKVMHSENEWAFVSMVYQFQKPVSVPQNYKLAFDLQIDDGTFSRVDVELKKANEDKQRLPVEICTQTKGEWKDHTIDFQRKVDKDVRENLKEICFTVKSVYADNSGKCKGKFTVKDMKFIKGS